VILFDADLTDPCTNDTPASFVKIAESFPTNDLHRIWSHRHDYIPQLQNDILQINRRVLKKEFDLMDGEHGVNLFR
jgi:hypothetical protein